VSLVVEGYAIQVPVAFSPARSFTTILGRLELVEAFDVAFDTEHRY